MPQCDFAKTAFDSCLGIFDEESGDTWRPTGDTGLGICENEARKFKLH